MASAAENTINVGAAISIGIFGTMFLVGSIPYHYLASFTYERHYQSLMQEALDRGLIKECPGVPDLRWDCNQKIEYQWFKPKDEETQVQDTP